ncbi:MAG: response regulator [Nitrospiraceae bacterium]|nr:response regulator [Nitrospiraceae bacterium]
MRLGKKILIVEDEAIAALSLKELLEHWEYETCEPAASGQEAIGMAESERPDIILMDIKLRGEMDGIGAAREITSRRMVPIIFMSGYSEDEMHRKAELEYTAFLRKPIDLDDLKKALESAAGSATVVRPDWPGQIIG